jgi:hypothetical protein
MKKILLLGLLLGLVGCEKSTYGGRPHQILCVDPNNSKIKTIDMIVPGDVIVFVLKGKEPLVAYRDDDKKTQIIRLKDNDCVID